MRYQLKTGTLLSNRYRIGDIIGSGGFSITYAATDEHLRMRVAVKELFDAEFMDRDVEKSTEVFLQNEKYQDIFETLKDNFLKEAIIIGIFNSDPAVVSVRDHFRENNTAYIIMEYLEGIPLSKYLEEKGRMEGAEIFGRMLPLLGTLRKIHDNEVIHRDISPDNIMVMPDQSFKLIDFGAARNYVVEEQLSRIVKDGYAPVEQWNKSGNQGPWTDIYALSATIYECITGAAPESAIQRLFLDEVKRPSELGISLNPELEKILWKGMAVDPEERYQKLEQMEADIKKIIQPPGPVTPPGTNIKKVIAASAASLVLGAGVIAGVFFFRDYKEAHKFDGIETHTTVLAPDEEMTAKEYYKARDIVKDRIQTLAGDEPYRIIENDAGEMTVTLPLDVFGNYDPEVIYREFIACLRFGEIGFYKEGRFYQSPLQPDDIVSVERKEGDIPVDPEIMEALDVEQTDYYLEIQLTGEKASELSEEMAEAGRAIYLLRYYDEEIQAGDGADIFFSEAHDRFYLPAPYWSEERLINLFEENLESEGFQQAFQYTCEIIADWENPENNVLAGKYQCSAEEIKGAAVTAVYKPDLIYGELTRDELIYMTVGMKDRLDALEIPYAVGYERGHQQNFVVKVDRAGVSKFVLETLFSNHSSFSVGTLWDTGDIKLSSASISVDASGNDQYQVTVQYEESDWADFQQYTEEMLQAGITDLYIKAGRYLPAKCTITEPIADGKIVFTQITDDGESAITESNRQLFEYIKVFATETEMNHFVIDYVLSETAMTNAEGDLEFARTFDIDVPVVEAADELKDEIKALYPGTIISESEVWNDPWLRIDLNLDQDENLIDNILTAVKQIYDLDYIKTGYFDEVYFRSIQGEKEERELSLVISLEKDTRLEVNRNSYYIEVMFVKQDQEDIYGDEIREKMEADAFFSQFLVDDSFKYD